MGGAASAPAPRTESRAGRRARALVAAGVRGGEHDVKGAAVRSRLLMLRRQLTAATTGHDLLERKLEVLLREALRRAARRDRQRARAAPRLAVARQRLADAC